MSRRFEVEFTAQLIFNGVVKSFITIHGLPHMVIDVAFGENPSPFILSIKPPP